MNTKRTRTPWLPKLLVTACAAALMPAVAQAQSGILHKRSYAPATLAAPSAAPLAASSAATISNRPADAAPGGAVGVAGSSGGGAEYIPLPKPVDLGDVVHIMPYPFEPGGPPPASKMPEVDTSRVMALNSQFGIQTASVAPPHAVPRTLPQPGARGLPERAVGVRPSGIAAPGPATSAQASGQVGRGRSAPHLQPVGVERPATPPRWRDRLRFSWPGGGK